MENLLNFLTKKSLTISCAESLTGGRIQTILTSKSGASAYFLGGITCYTLDQKVEHLGIDRRYAKVCNCVSERTVQEMVRGCKILFGSDIAVATTGYAETRIEGGVEVPFARIAVINTQNNIHTSKVIAPSSYISRNEMQDYVVSKVFPLILSISQKN